MSEYRFAVQDCWGVGSLRHCAGFPYHKENEYHVPIGCCIAKWNIKTRERELFQAHDDLITVLIANGKGYILSVSFGGEMKLWSDKYALLVTKKLPTDDVTFGCWSKSGDLIAVSSKGPRQMLLVYSLQSLLDSDKKDYQWCTSACEENVEIDNSINQSDQSIHDPNKKYCCFIACAFKENLQLLAILLTNSSPKIYLFDTDGSVIRTAVVAPHPSEVDDFVCLGTVHEDTIVVGLNHGIFGFYNATTLKCERVIKASHGSMACLWYDDKLFTMSYLAGVLMVWRKDGTMMHEIKDAPSDSIISFIPSVAKNSFMTGGIISLHQVVLSDDYSKMVRKVDLSLLKLAGCGLSVSDSNMVASGDLTGSVLLWEHNMTLPIHTVSAPGAIRSLLWIKDYLLIGLLSGEMYLWAKCKLALKTEDAKNSIKNVYSFIGSVVTMKCNNVKNQVAVGTTTGNLYVFEVHFSPAHFNMNLIYQKEVHKPKIIGGDKRVMEIWSLTWSVDDHMIATASEDQSCVISCAKSGDCLHVLTGHTSAVTSVDWKLLSTGDNILVTCGDDRTVRIYNGITYELRHIIEPLPLYGWYTLTYLCINSKRDLLICSTEHGHLLVWDIKKYKCLIKYKVHSGSIEGVVLDELQNCVYTTSSDCIVNRFSVVSS